MKYWEIFQIVCVRLWMCECAEANAHSATLTSSKLNNICSRCYAMLCHIPVIYQGIFVSWFCAYKKGKSTIAIAARCCVSRVNALMHRTWSNCKKPNKKQKVGTSVGETLFYLLFTIPKYLLIFPKNERVNSWWKRYGLAHLPTAVSRGTCATIKCTLIVRLTLTLSKCYRVTIWPAHTFQITVGRRKMLLPYATWDVWNWMRQLLDLVTI